MSYGGRGSYRGYRGRGGGGWRGSSRGSFSANSRGRFYSSSPIGYDSRPRAHFQGGGAGSSNERYSGRDRAENSFSRSFHQENEDYSRREFGMRGGSPDPPRKRMRPDLPSYSAGHSRRSHERSFSSGGNDYQSRSFYVNDKGSGGGYPVDKGSYRDMRESHSGEFSFRKPGLSRSPRGSFRGRAFSRGRLRGRGFNRSVSASTAFLSKRRSENMLPKRYLPTKSQDYLRRLKMLRLKRKFEEEDRREKKSDDDVEDNDEEDNEIDEKDERQDDEEEEGEVDELSSEEGEEGEEKEEGEVDGDSKENEEEKEDDGKEKSTKKKEPPILSTGTKVVAKKSKKVIKTDSGDEIKVCDEEPKLTNYLGQPFIQLRCPHCGFKGVTFKDYARHLSLKKHQIAMKLVFLRLRQSLAHMRVEQRKRQRHLDDESKLDGNLRTIFCKICKLNHRTLKSEHMATRAHKRMMEFLFPVCKICMISFKTPMLYEAHICDLSHIKRKARKEKTKGSPKEDVGNESASEFDASSFMVLDSVGSDDESEGESDIGEKSEKIDEDEAKDSNEKKKKKKETKLGAEHCKVIEAHYCDLCKTFLPLWEDMKRAVTVHCRSRTHLQRWMREVKILRRKAALLKQAKKEVLKQSRKESEEEEEKDEEKLEEVDFGDETELVGKQEEDERVEGNMKEQQQDHEMDGSNENRPLSKTEDEKMGDKSWLDDKESELSNEMEESKLSEEEDEDSRSRYDRFKQDKLEVKEIKDEENSKKEISKKKKKVILKESQMIFKAKKKTEELKPDK